ncbi:031b582d-4387-443a-936f-4991638c26cb [Thermothielavioides terrestris]|uniref:031b582d-4387-443a-936f-4991638c26cb n=1 Tax=Thermothielavioides terrestris TaxID=2587410 RepID=A0A3S4D8H9_9PEZI|nr:031b582d-4387-443a-936f-4991638c26cb [Thermothielavioides terrestris]
MSLASSYTSVDSRPCADATTAQRSSDGSPTKKGMMLLQDTQLIETPAQHASAEGARHELEVTYDTSHLTSANFSHWHWQEDQSACPHIDRGPRRGQSAETVQRCQGLGFEDI